MEEAMTKANKALMRRVRIGMRLARYLPGIMIPEDAVTATAETMKTTGQALGSFLMLLKGIGSFKFRKEVHLSDAELEDMIGKNMGAVMNTNREHTIEWNWIMLSGNGEAYNKYRTAVMNRVEGMRASEADARKTMGMDKFK